MRAVAEAYVGLALAATPPPLVNISSGVDHSIRELIAIATGLTEAEISAIEDGTSTDAHHIERIEHALG